MLVGLNRKKIFKKLAVAVYDLDLDPAAFESAAGEYEKAAGTYVEELETLNGILKNVTDEWAGDAHEAWESAANALVDGLKVVEDSLKKNATALRKIGSAVSEAEGQMSERVNAIIQ